MDTLWVHEAVVTCNSITMRESTQRPCFRGDRPPANCSATGEDQALLPAKATGG